MRLLTVFNTCGIKRDNTKEYMQNKITANECADAIVWAINQPQHIEIGELSIWRPFW